MAVKLEVQLGHRIKSLRERAKLSQADLARLSGKSVETISNFERGKTIASVRTLALLAQQLDCTIADFFITAAPAKPAIDDSMRPLGARLKMMDARDRQLLASIAELLARRGR